MPGTFNFAPNSLVPETLPPDPVQGVSLGGWSFNSKPTVPFQRKFKVTLHGMRWILASNGLYDITTTTTINARVLEIFYKDNGVWSSFSWAHPHLGTLTCRFASPLTVPAAIPGSGGWLEPLEVMLIEHSPTF